MDAQGEMVAGLSVHWHDRLSDIPPAQWDALLQGTAGAHPFLCHGLLSALVDSGSACAATGWQVHFLCLRDEEGHLRAACPLFLKHHSYGEYVFDWAWADAYDRAFASQGLTYYPKLLSAVPFSPIGGQRLLTHPALAPAHREQIRAGMLDLLKARCQALGLSSVHALFVSEEEARLAQAKGWLCRLGVQFHWRNRVDTPYADFEDFLGSLQRDKRKKIQQERRKVRDAGVTFDVLAGTQIQDTDWDFFHRCYTQTYHEHGQRPYLTRDFWRLAAQALPEAWVLFVAQQGGQRVAAALLAVDLNMGLAFGRYWGALTDISCLHFEACYYQPLSWCIAHRFHRFEGGAQGEHKLTRGLLPTGTQSIHWLPHDGFRAAVADHLFRETSNIEQLKDELGERSPFKPQDRLP